MANGIFLSTLPTVYNTMNGNSFDDFRGIYSESISLNGPAGMIFSWHKKLIYLFINVAQMRKNGTRLSCQFN
jgi:hypothetical protein